MTDVAGVSSSAVEGKWRTLCETEISYATPVVHEDYFKKLVFIMRNQMQTWNRCLRGSVRVGVDGDTATTERVWKEFPSDVLERIRVNSASEMRKLLPNRPKFSSQCFEVSIVDTNVELDEVNATFYPVNLEQDSLQHPHVKQSYKLYIRKLDDARMRFGIAVPCELDDQNYKWLRDNAFPIFVKWISRLDPDKEVTMTNRLIDLESYTDRYHSIKAKHGKEIVEKWSEKTDPSKFVYEDCGIAAYLLETFARSKRRPRCFADIGCGNGLLVHLLNKEGISGIGLDIRRRKIWDGLFSDTDLREVTVDPTAGNTGLPMDVDYLIGNHSDELTPWIAILAARRNCDFFVLPCCPFEFYGKFACRNGGSQYEAFYAYVNEVCLALGYIVEEDRLSIPSTKRRCFVCRVPDEGLVPNVEEVIARLTKPPIGISAKPFVARPMIATVKNCTSIPFDLRQQLTMRFFQKILAASDETIDGWHCGGAIPIKDLMQLVTEEEKAWLKDQDGGLQTFLKNQHQVFQIEDGCGRIRDWRRTRKQPAKKAPEKRQPCWMSENHPDGCALGSELCKFKHSP